MYCNGKKCGCDDQFCKDVRTRLRISKFEFDLNSKTFTIHPYFDFNYFDVYYFEMNLNRSLKSKLTLEFSSHNIPNKVLWSFAKDYQEEF